MWVDNTAAFAIATGNDFTHETVTHVLQSKWSGVCSAQDNTAHVCCYVQDSNVSGMMTKQLNGPQFKAHCYFVLRYADDVAASAPFAGVAVRRRRRGCRVHLLRV